LAAVGNAFATNWSLRLEGMVSRAARSSPYTGGAGAGCLKLVVRGPWRAAGGAVGSCSRRGVACGVVMVAPAGGRARACDHPAEARAPKEQAIRREARSVESREQLVSAAPIAIAAAATRDLAAYRRPRFGGYRYRERLGYKRPFSDELPAELWKLHDPPSGRS